MGRDQQVRGRPGTASADPVGPTMPPPGRGTRADRSSGLDPRQRPGLAPSPGHGGGLGHPLDAFAARFNREFAAQLHGFAPASAPSSEAATPTDQSGGGLTGSQLQALFTAGQIAKLDHFISSREVPDRLFDGDEVGHATAQQRILLAGHILTVGTIRPGSFTQRVHARMCGHWVALVYHYAGAGSGAGAGVIEQFDHAGGLSLSVEDDPEHGGVVAARHHTVFQGARIHKPGVHSRFQQEGLAFERFDEVQPGDWLYVYNDNGSPGGQHSVVFSRWASEDLVVEDPAGGTVSYRRAVTMSQIGPSAGGREEVRLLGERFVAHGQGHITPITRVARAGATTRPIRRAEDLVAILGSGPEAAENQRFVARHTHGGSFDWQLLAAHLHGRNAALIDELAGGRTRRMTPQQERIFRDTNNRQLADASVDSIGTLVRLNERLAILVRNAAAQTTGAEGTRETAVETQHAALDARLRPQIEALTAERERIRAHIAELEHAQELAEEHEDELDGGAALRAARARRRRERPELRAQLRSAHTDVERDAIRARIEELSDAVSDAEATDRANRVERREAHREVRHLGGEIRRETNHEILVARQLGRLDGEAGYHTAAGGVTQQTFQGRGEHRVTGLLRNLVPAPPWGDFVRGEDPHGG